MMSLDVNGSVGFFDMAPVVNGDVFVPKFSRSTLDPLSRRVVFLAREEAPRCRKPANTRSAIAKWFLGTNEAPLPLADPQLEALRKFCTSVLNDDRDDHEYAETILGKGYYTQEQLIEARNLSLEG